MLFRKEVVAQQSERLTGGIILAQQNNSLGVALSPQLVEQLSMQIQLLNDEITQNHTLQKQELLNLQAQKSALTNEQTTLEHQLKLPNDQVCQPDDT